MARRKKICRLFALLIFGKYWLYSASIVLYNVVVYCISPSGIWLTANSDKNSVGSFRTVSSGVDAEDHGNADVRVLIELYLACVDAVLSAIRVYSKTLSTKQAQKVAEDSVHECCRKLNLPRIADHFQIREHLKFCIEAYDNNNRKVPLTDGSVSLYVKTCEVVLFDIPSQHKRNASLGSVGFAESFINSTLKTAKPDGSVQLDGDLFVPTTVVPRFLNWMIERSEIYCHAEVEKCLAGESYAGLGRRLSEGHAACLLVERTLEALDNGLVHFFEQGIVFTQSGHGTLVVPKSELTALRFFDGDSPSLVALLLMSYKPGFIQYVPPVLQSKTNMLIFALQPKTKAYRVFFSQVLISWREEDNAEPLQVLKELPESLLDLHQSAQMKYDALSTSGVSSLKQHMGKLQDLQRFLTHFSISSVNEVLIPSNDLPAVLNQSYDPNLMNSTPLVAVTIVAGVPGSGQLHLVDSLTRLGKEDRWEVIREPVDLCEGFDPTPLQERLTRLMGELQQKPRDVVQKFRVVVVFSGFTDLVPLIQAISVLPEKSLKQHITIGAVTICMDPRNAYMSHRYTLPGLLDQCAQGWVNNVVFTGSSAELHPQQEELQRLVRAANSDVALMSAPGGKVTRSPDIQLIMSSTSFNTNSLVRARHLNCPGWWNTRNVRTSTTPHMENIMLPFSQPLNKLKLLAKLNGLKACHKPYPFEGNIYHIQGSVQFEDIPNIYEISYTPLSGRLTLDKASHSPSKPCSLVFMGRGLTENQLKDWLRGCARQKPEKRVLKTRETLSTIEIKKIHNKHHLEALPEGWYFNGSQYLNFDGAKSSLHPSILLSEPLDHRSV